MAIMGNSEEIGMRAYPNSTSATLNLIHHHPALNFKFHRNTSSYYRLSSGKVGPNFTSIILIIELAQNFKITFLTIVFKDMSRLKL